MLCGGSLQEDNVGITYTGTFVRLFPFTKNRVNQPGRCALPWKSLSLEDLSKLLKPIEVNAITLQMVDVLSFSLRV